MKSGINAEKVKNILIIEWIKLKNLVKEHKYISSVFGLFLFSCVIGVVVFAQEDDYEKMIESTIKNVTISQTEKLEENEVYSFDNVVYNFNYVIKNKKDDNVVNRDVEITAKICDHDDATWDNCNSNVDANWEYGVVDDNVSYTIDEENKVLNILVHEVSTGEKNTHFQNAYLKVNNIEDKTKINTLFRVKEITEENIAETNCTITVRSTEQPLLTKLVSGNAYKAKPENFNGRYAPFGILVGFEGDTLKGKYFSDEKIIKLNAKSDDKTAEIDTDKEYYGIYKKDSKLIDIPNGVYDDRYTNDFVYDSGNVSLEKLESETKSTHIEEKKSSALYLLGDKNLTLEVGELYNDPGVSLSKSGASLNNDKYKMIFKNSKNEEISDYNTMVSKEGTYKIGYVYDIGSAKTTIYRNVEVIASKSVRVDGNIYSLNGNYNINLVADKRYEEEPGILKNGKLIYINNDSDVTVEITKDDNIETLGGKIRYTIISKKDPSIQKILIRNVNVINSADEMGVDEVLLNDSTAEKCTGEGCKISYYKDSEEINDISSVQSGTYDVEYKLLKEDYEVIIISEIIVSKDFYYELKITDIKTDDIYYKDDNFIALGAYFVNVKSIRDEGNNKDISITLISNDTSQNLANCINPNISLGNKELVAEFYNDFEQKLDNNSLIAYDDEVILNLKFTYSINGDYSLGDFNVKIPIDSNYFTLQSYSSEIEDTDVYYKTDADNIKVEYYNSNNEQISIDSDESDLAYIMYKLEKVNPGDEINFSIRLKLKDKSEVSINNVKCSYMENNQDKEIFINPNTKLFVNAFRSNATITINDLDEAIVDESKLSTIAIYPEIVMPSARLNASKNLILDSVQVKVTLPDKINYVNNESYMKPKISDKTLTYTYNGKKTNDWFDPIYIDVNCDIDTENDAELPVKTEVNATSVSPAYHSIYKASNSIVFHSENNIRSSLTSKSKIISKNTLFSINFNTYNTFENKKDVGTIILLPYNSDIESNKLFNGEYRIELPDDVLCTTESSSKIVSESDDIISKDIWKGCNEYSSKKITAIKIVSSNNISKEFNIEPVDNKPGDMYVFKSYVYSREQEKYNIIKEGNVTVSVVSRMITGTVWEDFNEDGIMDEEENKIPGVVLKLYNEKGSYVGKTVSNEKGQYSLGVSAIGKYYVVPEYDTSKYSLTSSRVNVNKSKNSVFDFSGDTYKIQTNIIEFSDDTKTVENINLGLALRKFYNVKLSKYISKVISTNRLGISTIRDFENASLVKVDVKDLANTKVKVVYTIELENIGYYPGYIYKVVDYFPDGMTFNKEYEENKGWILNKDGYVENKTLQNKLMYSNDKQFLTLAFDISRKEAGSFVNIANIDEEDLKVYVMEEDGGEDEDAQE